ncbi:MAG: PaaI family thioesterase [Flavobacteriaceae bacterium]|nr:PaaI family thioesterase [Flavobacteriaceae bacterium]MDG2315116.1 PaaI family thioesterase [Flavobacteriaceae bacterium]
MNSEEILQRLNERNTQTFMRVLNIEYIDTGDDYLVAKMPVTPDTHQPDGVLHGGVTAALAESVGSAASSIRANLDTHFVRGIEISANHLKSVSDGFVIATAKAIHLGRTLQLWDIRVSDENDQLISSCKLTTITLPKKQ